MLQKKEMGVLSEVQWRGGGVVSFDQRFDTIITTFSRFNGVLAFLFLTTILTLFHPPFFLVFLQLIDFQRWNNSSSVDLAQKFNKFQISIPWLYAFIMPDHIELFKIENWKKKEKKKIARY